MKSFITFISESFDSKALDFKRVREGKYEFEYEFNIDDTYYIVNMMAGVSNKDLWDISFGIQTGPDDWDYGVTGTGNMGKVMSTVIACINDFIDKIEENTGHLPTYMKFSADKRTDFDDDSGKNRNARANIYFRLLKKNIPKQYEYSVTNRNDEDIFLMSLKKEYHDS